MMSDLARVGVVPLCRKTGQTASETEARVGPRHVGTTFTIDVEDYRGDAYGLERCRSAMDQLFGFFAAQQISATLFFEGTLVRRAPELVRRAADEGHEVASHGCEHKPLSAQAPHDFAIGMRAARLRLEDLAGAAVLGFRAPEFSLTPHTRWAVSALLDAGFIYSSSVIPGPALVAGYRGVPERVFRWPEGLLEIPCPVGRIGPVRIPFQGGMYLRYLPPWRYRSLRSQLGEQVDWTYCHPYDVDLGEALRRVPGHGIISSLLMRARRGVILRRWAKFAKSPAEPFASRLAAFNVDAVAAVI